MYVTVAELAAELAASFEATTKLSSALTVPVTNLFKLVGFDEEPEIKSFLILNKMTASTATLHDKQKIEKLEVVGRVLLSRK